MKSTTTTPFAIVLLAGIVSLVAFGWFEAGAFIGPSSGGGVGNGAVGVNGSNNLSIGTSTPLSDTKLLIVGSSTASTDYALQVLQSTGGPLLIVRNDGKIGVDASPNSSYALYVNGNENVNGAVTATSFSGLFAGTVAANNVLPGVFSTSSGNFAFRSSLNVNTSTLSSLPAELSVNGNGYFSGSLSLGYLNNVTSVKRIYAVSFLNPAAASTKGAHFYADDTGSTSATTTVIGVSGSGLSAATGGPGSHSGTGVWASGFATDEGASPQSQTAIGAVGQTETFPTDIGYEFYARNYFDDASGGYPSTGGTQMGLYIEMLDPDVTNYGIYQVTPNPNYFAGRIGIGALPTSTALLYMRSATSSSAYAMIDTTDVSTSTAVAALLFGEGGATKWSLGNAGSFLDVFFISSALGNAFAITQGGNVGIGTLTPQSGLHVPNGKYAQFEKQSAGAPLSTDCDNNTAFRGRVSLDTTNNRLYVCIGTSTAKWSYVNLN